MAEKPENFMFMKVGNHAGEDFESIIKRKMDEFHKTGMIFWGYGGNTCHPLTQVRPFVKSVVEKGGMVHLLMEPIDSRAEPDLLPATEYSDDGLIWKPIPKGIRVVGSRYAVVLGEIKPSDFELPLGNYHVGIGRSRGYPADKYIKGRVDKACLSLAEVRRDAEHIVQIGFTAEIIDPYAVMVRNSEAIRPRKSFKF